MRRMYGKRCRGEGERDSQEGVAGTGGFREHRTGQGEGGEGRRVVQRAETALLYRAEHA